MPKHMSIKDRFWQKVDKRGPNECWPWVGAKVSWGHGVMAIGGRNKPATHLSYEFAHGTPVPNGVQLNHHCDNGACVNPAHLYAGTQLDNMRDRVERGRCNASHGESHCHAKLNEKQVAYIRSKYVPRKITQQQLAGELGVHRVTVGEALRGITWKQTGVSK